MTLPQPRHFAICEMGDQRQRLRVVHDDRVAIVKMKTRSVLEYDFFVNGSFSVRKIQALALQGIVELLGAAKEAGRSLNQMPVRFDSRRVHHEGERRKQLGDASA